MTARLSFHRLPVFEVPLNDELGIPIYMDMARRMITFPGEKNVVSATDLAHAQALPQMVTPASYKSHLTVDFGDASNAFGDFIRDVGKLMVPGLFFADAK